MPWIAKLTTVVRLLLGAAYLINGTNWFFKIISPYPSMSDFVDYLPPPDIVGALIENGILFHMAKAIEVVAGIALLSNRLVPLALVVSMAVTVPVFITDVFKPEFRLRAFLMGSGSLVMNVYLLLAYFDHYRPMLAVKAHPTDDPATPRPETGGVLAHWVGTIGRPLMRLLAPLAAVMGLAMLIWLTVLIAQYAASPKAIHEVRPMTPRPRHIGN
ncbi:MAG: hypothetical protein JWM75_505 [Sphingomonas bacterium]|nr:hypothetical protein [Sphingomonas bacterium]